MSKIDRIAASGTKQQIVIKQMAIQVRAIQKQLDKVNEAVNRFRRIPNTTKRKNNNKSKRNTRSK